MMKLKLPFYALWMPWVTKPEDYAEMIQRCLANKAQQRAESGESSKVSKLDVQENGNAEEDLNL